MAKKSFKFNGDKSWLGLLDKISKNHEFNLAFVVAIVLLFIALFLTAI